MGSLALEGEAAEEGASGVFFDYGVEVVHLLGEDHLFPGTEGFDGWQLL